MKGSSPIQVAAYYGHVDCVLLLLKAGASMASKTCTEAQLLQLACHRGHAWCARVIAAGKPIAGSNIQGKCSAKDALCFACEYGRADIAGELLQQPEGSYDGELSRALYRACLGGYADCVQLLIDAGSELNFRRGYAKAQLRRAPLHIAC